MILLWKYDKRKNGNNRNLLTVQSNSQTSKKKKLDCKSNDRFLCNRKVGIKCVTFPAF